MSNTTKPTYSVIMAATLGDPLAIQSILRYYRKYIFRLASYTIHDEYGNAYTAVDMDTFDQLEDTLISGILKFEDA